MEVCNDTDFYKRLEKFPFTFKLENGHKINLTRLKEICQISLDYNDFDNGEMEARNLLVWMHYSLAKHQKAVELSKKAVEFGDRKNLTSWGNRAYILWKMGNKPEAKQCLDVLESLEKDEVFPKLLTEAKAEQAYSYRVLGGPKNLKRAINMYSEVVENVPNNYKWKYGLARAYMEVSDDKILCLNSEKFEGEVCEKKAITYLFEVAENGDNDMQPKAYSKLAYMRTKYRPENKLEYDALFKHLNVQQLSDKALEKGREIANILSNCGRAVSDFDVEQSIKWLQDSVAIKGQSNSYYYLGKSYFMKAKSLEWNPPRYSSRKFPHDDADKLVINAIESFTEALTISEQNLSAILDLGILLRKTNQIEKALSNFIKLTKSCPSTLKERLTIITAHEHAGLCYLQNNRNPYCNSELREKKLTIAVSLAADLVKLMPEYSGHEKTIWEILIGSDRRSETATQLTEKITILKLAEVHINRVEVLQKLLAYGKEDIAKPDTILSTVSDYLVLHQPEKALAFLSLATLNPNIPEELWKVSQLKQVRTRTLQQTISSRLRDPTENPTVLFQQLFKHCFGACFGFHPRGVDNEIDLPGFVGDVLVVFDGNNDSQENPSSTVKAARCLKIVSYCLFGLEGEENNKAWNHFNECQREHQLNEIKKYQVVVIVLGNEDRNPQFFKYLEDITTMPTKQRIIVVDAGLREGLVPSCLRQHECLKLEDIGGLGDIDDGPSDGRDGDGQISFVDILQKGFHGNVDAIMKLFCFIIGQQWLCA